MWKLKLRTPVSQPRLSRSPTVLNGAIRVVDLSVMQRVGLAIAPANAHPWVSTRAHWQTKLTGGAGAAREVCDLLLVAQGKAETELAYWL